MQQRRSWSRPLIVLLSLIAFSCAKVPDVPLCKEITPDKGFCAYTLTPGGFYVDDSRPYAFDPREVDEQGKPVLRTWWEIRPVMIQIPPYSWEKLKTYIIKQCRQTRSSRRCRGEVGEWMDALKAAQ